MKVRDFIGVTLFSLVSVTPLSGLVFYDSGDPAFHTSDPFPERGWKYQGYFGQFLGTAIGPRHFITSGHIGVYEEFVSDVSFNGTGTVTYNVDPLYNEGILDLNGNFVPGRTVPGTDLRIYQVEETFSEYAAIYTGSSESTATVRLFGNSSPRGAAVIDGLGNTRGWEVGTLPIGTARWGAESVQSVDSDFLYTYFEGVAGETMLNVGDSGGGLFLEDGGTWKLAGIHYGATLGPWDFDSDHSSVFHNANIFDGSGMYYFDGSTWIVVNNELASSAHSRISTSASAIQSMLVVAVPEPQSLLFGLLAALWGWKRKRL